MAGTPAAAQTGADDGTIENAHTVGDIQIIFHRCFEQNRFLRDEIVQHQAMAQQQTQAGASG